jgi:hypothetical protein
VYSSSIVDLGARLGMELLVQVREVQTSVAYVTDRIGELSISAESHFQTLELSTSVGINKILQEMAGNLLRLYVMLIWQTMKNAKKQNASTTGYRTR